MVQSVSEVKHTMYIGPPCFPVFNDYELSNEPVTFADIADFERSDSDGMKFAASAAWSSGTEWYFVVLPDGIVLLNCHNKNGLFCRKKSMRFIDGCMKRGLIRNTIDNKKWNSPL